MHKKCNDFTHKNNLFRIGYCKWNDNNMPSKHFHNHFEIFYPFSGERLFFINDRTFLIRAGDFAIIKPNVLHKATNTISPGCERIVINFSENFLPSNFSLIDELPLLFENEYNIFSLPLNLRTFSEDIFASMLHECTSKNIGFEPLLQSLLVQLLVHLERQVLKCKNTSFEHINPIHEKISQIVLYINTHYTESISISTLSNRFFISASYMSKLFKEYTGFTFVEYLNNVRIKAAKKYLTSSSMKVVEIAEEVGFGSLTHFGRIFKEVTGHPPLYYRKLPH